MASSEIDESEAQIIKKDSSNDNVIMSAKQALEQNNLLMGLFKIKTTKKQNEQEEKDDLLSSGDEKDEDDDDDDFESEWSDFIDQLSKAEAERICKLDFLRGYNDNLQDKLSFYRHLPKRH